MINILTSINASHSHSAFSFISHYIGIALIFCFYFSSSWRSIAFKGFETINLVEIKCSRVLWQLWWELNCEVEDKTFYKITCSFIYVRLYDDIKSCRIWILCCEKFWNKLFDRETVLSIDISFKGRSGSGACMYCVSVTVWRAVPARPAAALTWPLPDNAANNSPARCRSARTHEPLWCSPRTREASSQ